MKNLLPFCQLFLLTVLSLLLFSACEKDTTGPIDPDPDPDSPFSLGWNAQEENTEDIPSDISFNFGNQNLPSSYDLTDRFPPVGDQNPYGTCVAFSVGYHTKTAINAIDNNLFTSNLTDPSMQTSALDLFLSIPDRGANCEGAQFEPAMKVLAERGVANSQLAPYVNVGDCSQSPDPSWAESAAKNKIQNFRKVEQDVTALKRYIADNRPVIFGARLGDNFMSWNSDEVITGHTSFNQVGIHAYHAMSIVGYDDSKGPNGAFRVINSWGTNWGDAGFIWVDYNFMVDPEWGFTFFVMQNDASDLDPNDNPPPAVSEIDLLPWGLFDDMDVNGSSARDRSLFFDIYNIGYNTVNSSNSWDMIYCFVDPTDAEDWGVILHSHITDQMGNPGELGDNPDGYGISNFWINTDIPSGSSMGYELFQDNIVWNYTMPNLNGYYYLVMVVDPLRNLNELDKMNNYYWIGDADGFPIYFENGVPFGVAGEEETSRLISGSNNTFTSKEDFQMDLKTLNQSQNWNAYSNSEIGGMLQHQFKNNLVEKVSAVDHSATIKKSSRKASR